MASTFKGKGTPEISRFKGLGEMPSAQLRETTMDPAKRVILRVTVEENGAGEATAELVDSLMGRKPELRLAYIQKHAQFVDTIDV
jgi:topoisomerase-4 subunit B